MFCDDEYDMKIMIMTCMRLKDKCCEFYAGWQNYMIVCIYFLFYVR